MSLPFLGGRSPPTTPHVPARDVSQRIPGATLSGRRGAAHGVAAARITTISYGKEKPIDPGTGEEAWAHNRNAHTTITAGAVGGVVWGITGEVSLP